MRKPFLLAALALAAAPAAAHAATDATLRVASSQAWLRTCHAKPLADSATVRTGRATVGRTGIVWATMHARGDWDLAIFDAKTKRLVAAAAGPDGDEIAEGFALAGTPLLVQACHVNGVGGTARIAVGSVEIPLASKRERVQLVSVLTPTAQAKRQLLALGVDDAEQGDATHVSIVLHGDDDAAMVRRAGFTWTVEVPDLVHQFFANRIEERRWRAGLAQRRREGAPAVAGMPSGRTDYRHLADYEADMKKLAAEHPGLVRLFTMAHPSLEGRDIMGVEIAKNVNVPDGKPVFLQVGVHHAREWPAGEMPMEWAFELVNNYGKDERTTRLVNATRNAIVPIINPDGFNLTRESPIDLGNPLASIDLPPDIDSQLPITDPTYTAAILADQNAGTFAYKRRNCRIKDGSKPEPGECGTRDNRVLGTDNNRNYGQYWGGGGASFDPTDDTYRGAGPFSEPESDNVRAYVSTHQVVTLITNHTFTGLVLRPPGIKAIGTTVDEAHYKALGDAMAKQNGYTSEYGYQLYDTTGTTEDWTYAATGGFGFTFEIGPDEFHPPYNEVIDEWDGNGSLAKKTGGKGNREAYYVALEDTANKRFHSVIVGRAPKGVTIHLRKDFKSTTSPVIQDISGTTKPAILFDDALDFKLPIAKGGRFSWVVNPSTRPAVALPKTTSDVAEKPAQTIDASSPVPILPGNPKLVEFDVKPDAARQIVASVGSSVPVDDYDIYLYKDKVDADHQEASSASASAEELIKLDNPAPGHYILEIRNFSAVGPVTGSIKVYGVKPGSLKTIPSKKESYVLTCERKGKVVAKRRVFVARGKTANVGAACTKAKKRRKR